MVIKKVQLQNGIDHDCTFHSLNKLNILFKQTGYIMDKSVCNGSLTNKKTKELHFKYHAEKKALAVLLTTNTNNDNHNLCITISMRMCRDCHNFFAKMSGHLNKTIECVDVNGIHVFERGVCSLCDNK